MSMKCTQIVDNGMSGLCKALLGTIWILWIPWDPDDSISRQHHPPKVGSWEVQALCNALQLILSPASLFFWGGLLAMLAKELVWMMAKGLGIHQHALA